MTARTTAIGLALLTAFAVLTPSVALADQDALNRAKDYYASASYDEALQVLGQLRDKSDKSTATEMTEVAAYQMLCLVALGRNQEATEAIAALVRVDPDYRPSETEASPRMRAFFDKVRQPMLPGLVKQIYAKAKENLQKKEMAQATRGFDRVIALVDEIGPTEDDSLSDLRTLALGFRDLSKATTVAATPPPVPAATPAPASPVVTKAAGAPESSIAAILASAAASRTPAEGGIYSASDADVVKPIVLSRAMPAWHPTSAIDRTQAFRGNVDLVIDPQGRVVKATIAKSVHRDYDPQLLRAAVSWQFQPATRNGTPVSYRYSMDIQLSASAGR